MGTVEPTPLACIRNPANVPEIPTEKETKTVAAFYFFEVFLKLE